MHCANRKVLARFRETIFFFSAWHQAFTVLILLLKVVTVGKIFAICSSEINYKIAKFIIAVTRVNQVHNATSRDPSDFD